MRIRVGPGSKVTQASCASTRHAPLPDGLKQRHNIRCPPPLQLPKDTVPAKVPAETVAQAAVALRSAGCTLLEVSEDGTKIKRKEVGGEGSQLVNGP